MNENHQLRVIGWLCLVLALATTTEAQPPPSAYPVEGRFGCVGYDPALVVPGDLASPLPGSGLGLRNGVLYVLPSRNVTFRQDIRSWSLEVGIWTGTSYRWFPTIAPADSCLYYPEVPGDQPDPHGWYQGTPDISEVFPIGRLRCHGYDGVVSIPGDTYGNAADDGVIFSLPADSAHILKGDGLWHLRLTVTDELGVVGPKWAVYPTAACHYDGDEVAP